MNDKHLASLSSMEVMMLHYRRDVSLKELIKLNAPEKIIKHATEMLQETFAARSERGITENQYKEFEAEYWTVFAADQMSQNMKCKCLVWLKHCREYMDKDYYDPAECTTRNEICGPFCAEWVEASGEQQDRYFYNLDLETGESLPNTKGMDDLFADEDQEEDGAE
jgi:hypothetical protein